MARENQGLQAALIVFVIISLGLAVTTFLYFRSSNEQSQRAQAAENAAQSARQERDAAVLRLGALKYMVSEGGATTADLEAELANHTATFSGDEEMEQIVATFEQNMDLFGEQYQENRNYSKLPQFLITTIRDLNRQIAQRDAELNKCVQEKQQVEKNAAERIAAAQQAQQQAAADLEQERQKFNQQLAQLRNQMQTISQEVGKKDEALKKLASTSTQQQDELQKQLNQQKDVVQQLREKIEGLYSPEFEVADGEITWVNQRGNSVWINLGSADGLRRQTTFSVYGADENGVMNQNKKGSIEVTQIRNEHLAEARILADDSSNIILPGDKIHTPAWRPGQEVRFALIGTMDVDGDGTHDIDLVRNLIQINNGVVDVEVTPEGEQKGQLSPQTRYLVFGGKPDEKTSPAFTKAWSSVIDQAQQYGVERIQLDEFLDYMGWKGQVRTVTLGRGSDSRTRPAGGANGQRSGNASDAFRPRTPPASAF